MLRFLLGLVYRGQATEADPRMQLFCHYWDCPC
jgi:hypothetical protein